MTRLPSLASLALALSACSGGAHLALPDGGDAGEPPDSGSDSGPGSGGDAGPDAGADAGPDAGPTVLAGALIGGPGALPGPIEGVAFTSGGQSGFTDAQGAFTYEAGADVTFAIAEITLRPAPGAALLSPFALAGDGSCHAGDDLTKLLVLLEGLDDDGDPSTGLRLAHFAPSGPARALSSLSLGDVQARIAALIPGRAAPAPQAALDDFIRQIDGEEWAQTSLDTFSGAGAARRSQGAATDGTSWFFSWRLGLERTNLDYAEQDKNDLAIPVSLALAGSNHIGDIDLYAGQLFAPIEDGTAYKAPYLVLYDPVNLKSGDTHALPPSLLTQGVPWVAVDGPRASIYVAEWNPTVQLEVFGLAGFAHQGSIPLSATMGRIQGAKVYQGALYAAEDDADKTIFKIDLETGTVLPLFSMKHGNEQEGLAFLDTGAAQMHTLNVTASTTGIEFRHHARTRAPLRLQLCP